MRRDWTAGPIAVALCAALVAAGALWLSADRWPAGIAQAALWAVLTASCVYTANRNLRAELAEKDRLLDAWNSSEARDDLSAVGPVSPPAGTRSVELYDWADQAEYGILNVRLHLGQPCYVCGKPATAWTEERQQDPYGDTIEERTFLCDDHYAAAMSEEDGRG